MSPDDPLVDSLSAPEPAYWPPARVLIAEADATLRGVVAAALQKHGFDVLEAADGIALLERIADELLNESELPRIDVILCDMSMPDWPGLDVLAGLTATSTGVPIVLLTPDTDEHTRETAARFGARAILKKPFDIDELCAVVATAMMGA